MLSAFGAPVASGLISMILHNNSNNSYNDSLDAANQRFDKYLADARARSDQAIQYADQGIGRVQDLINREQGRDSLKEVEAIVNGYSPSAYNQYLENRSIGSITNTMKNLGLYESPTGRQEIANTAATAASSGLDSYINTILGNNRAISNNVLGLSGQQAALAGQQVGAAQSSASDIARAGGQALAGDLGSANEIFREDSKPSIFDRMTSNAVDEYWDQRRVDRDIATAQRVRSQLQANVTGVPTGAVGGV